MRKPDKTLLMIIDDDPFMVKAIEFALLQRGFSVHSVHDAEQAFLKLKDQVYDFFLVDLVLPGMNGFEFVKKLKALPGYSSVPILMMTARTEAKDSNHAKEVGAKDILVKPFDLEFIADRIVEEVKKKQNESRLQHG